MITNLLRRRRGADRLRRLGLEADARTRCSSSRRRARSINGTTGRSSRTSASDLTYVGRLRGYRDLTEATNLDLGASFAYGHNDAGPDCTTRLFGVDATFRYRPLRRAIYRRFLGRTELFWSRRGQERRRQSAPSASTPAATTSSRGAGSPARATTGPSARTTPSLVDKGGSLVLTFWPSEFSQIRGQYRRTRLRGGRDRQRVPVPVPVLDRRARRARVLVSGSSHAALTRRLELSTDRPIADA